MNEFNKAKKSYDSIEIPQELGRIVREAISSDKKKNPVKAYLMHFAPVAVCALICFSIGINYIFDFEKSKNIDSDASQTITEASADAEFRKALKSVPNESDVEAVPERFSMRKNADEDSAVADKTKALPAALYNSFVQIKINKSIEECVELENTVEAYGELQEIYSDEEVISYSVTTYPSNMTNFYNVKQSDGSDISIESIMGDDSEYNSSNCEFYIKERDKLIVIQNGKEVEILID